jgi:hypothetical protein
MSAFGEEAYEACLRADERKEVERNQSKQIAEAERRGRLAGLREAQNIAVDANRNDGIYAGEAICHRIAAAIAREDAAHAAPM